MTAPTLRRALPDYYAALEIHEDFSADTPSLCARTLQRLSLEGRR